MPTKSTSRPPASVTAGPAMGHSERSAGMVSGRRAVEEPPRWRKGQVAVGRWASRGISSDVRGGGGGKGRWNTGESPNDPRGPSTTFRTRLPLRNSPQDDPHVVIPGPKSRPRFKILGMTVQAFATRSHALRCRPGCASQIDPSCRSQQGSQSFVSRDEAPPQQ